MYELSATAQDRSLRSLNLSRSDPSVIDARRILRVGTLSEPSSRCCLRIVAFVRPAWIHAIRARYGHVTHQPDDPGPVADLETEDGEAGTPIAPWVVMVAILSVVAAIVLIAWR